MIPHVTTEVIDTFTHVSCLEFEHKGEFMIANVDATLKIVDGKFILETLNSWSLCDCVHPFLLSVISVLDSEIKNAVQADLEASIRNALIESIKSLPEQITNEPTNFTENAT